MSRCFVISESVLQQGVAKLLWDESIAAEYTLRDIHKPIGIFDCELIRALSENLKSTLPKVEEIEAELGGDLG
jgi:hypothetical protein